jgi:hypothetical protein
MASDGAGFRVAPRGESEAAAILADSVRAASAGNPSRPWWPYGGAAGVTTGSPPAGQQVEHHQPDSHQSKKDD